MTQPEHNTSHISAADAEEIQIDREDVILLLLESAERVLGWRAFHGVTRMEKLLFLLDKETDFHKVGATFIFKPYNFGPFSKEVYEAVDFLEGCGLIEVQEKPYPSYYANYEEAELLDEMSDSDAPDDISQYQIGATEKIFRLTNDGRIVAQSLAGIVTQRNDVAIKQLEDILKRYGGLSLNQIIRYVYRRYPDMAEKSVHREASNLNAAT